MTPVTIEQNFNAVYKRLRTPFCSLKKCSGTDIFQILFLESVILIMIFDVPQLKC